MSKILIINSGSSSIKYQLIEMPEETVLCKGLVEEIGTGHSSFKFEDANQKVKKEINFNDHKEGLQYVINFLLENNVIKDLAEIEGCGHRVAHGGEDFKDSAIIDEEAAQKIKDLATLAPLHNPKNILGYEILKEMLPNCTHIAGFDTAFHQTIEKSSYMYPIPYEYYENYRIRKYGFHGTSHKYVSQKAAEMLGEDKAKRIIVCHLGNGASLAAVKNGESIDTSMGLSPLGGIMMGTRSGNIDPAVIEYLAQMKNIDVYDVLKELNQKSGLLGVSEKSQDMRILCEEAEAGDEHAKLALDMFVRRVVDYMGAYYLQLEGLDTIVFTAGIGENSSIIRKMILDKVKVPLHIEIDEDKNNNCHGDFEIISTEKSQVNVCVIPTNEEMMIARDTYSLIAK